MALDRSARLELLDVMRSADGGELMRRLLATIVQLLVDAEATAFVGAERHERSQARTNRRNGTRDKLVATAILVRGESRNKPSDSSDHGRDVIEHPPAEDSVGR